MSVIHKSGKRKRAIARATLREGTGIIRVNKNLLDNYNPVLSREKIREPLLIAGEIGKKVDIDVKVFGGGITSQAEAARLAIGRVLSGYAPELKEKFDEYDWSLLTADTRRKETRKPNDSKARAKRQKSYR